MTYAVVDLEGCAAKTNFDEQDLGAHNILKPSSVVVGVGGCSYELGGS